MQYLNPLGTGSMFSKTIVTTGIVYDGDGGIHAQVAPVYAT